MFFDEESNPFYDGLGAEMCPLPPLSPYPHAKEDPPSEEMCPLSPLSPYPHAKEDPASDHHPRPVPLPPCQHIKELSNKSSPPSPSPQPTPVPPYQWHFVGDRVQSTTREPRSLLPNFHTNNSCIFDALASIPRPYIGQVLPPPMSQTLALPKISFDWTRQYNNEISLQLYIYLQTYLEVVHRQTLGEGDGVDVAHDMIITFVFQSYTTVAVVTQENLHKFFDLFVATLQARGSDYSAYNAPIPITPAIISNVDGDELLNLPKLSIEQWDQCVQKSVTSFARFFGL